MLHSSQKKGLQGMTCTTVKRSLRTALDTSNHFSPSTYPEDQDLFLSINTVLSVRGEEVDPSVIRKQKEPLHIELYGASNGHSTLWSLAAEQLIYMPGCQHCICRLKH